MEINLSNFWSGLGLALMIFAFTGPLAYCEMNKQPVTNSFDLVKACIEQHGQWGPADPDAWFSPQGCKFPEKQAADKGK